MGVVRKADTLGRFVVPKEMREQLGIQPGGFVEIDIRGGEIIVKRFAPTCKLCGSIDDVITHPYTNEPWICTKCAEEVKQLAKT